MMEIKRMTKGYLNIQSKAEDIIPKKKKYQHII